MRRIYAPQPFTEPRSHTVGPTTFRYFGPLERFDHHRQSDPPSADSDHGIYYAADELWDCAVEVFARTGIIQLAGNRFAEVLVLKDLELVDLGNEGAISIGTFSMVSKVGPRRIPQAWARYIHRYPTVFTHRATPVDGLRFFNAHNDGVSVALFERASRALQTYSDRALRTPVIRLALEKRASTAPAFTVEA